MDPVADAFYALYFRIAFLEKKGAAFQDWFAKLAGHAFGSDFEAVRAYGKQGDWKCDGRLKSNGTIFQCYAPETESDQKTIAKIDADLAGAVHEWPDFIKRWVFVHNDTRGVPPAVANHLDGKRKEYPRVDIEIWLEADLLGLFVSTSIEAKRLMFGVAPTQRTVNSIGLADLEPVISALESREPDPNDEVPQPPSAEKLEKNALSRAASDLLKVGRLRARLVETYFAKNVRVELGEKIAEAFRDRYADLRALGLSADQIFHRLQELAGVAGEPKRQVAAMAVLAYFFDRCDIFEDPDEEAVGA